MRKERTLFVIGLWVSVLPFTGFPSSWRVLLYVLTGLALLYLSYLFYKQAKANMPKDKDLGKAFVDNIGSGE